MTRPEPTPYSRIKSLLFKTPGLSDGYRVWIREVITDDILEIIEFSNHPYYSHVSLITQLARQHDAAYIIVEPLSVPISSGGTT